MITPEALADQLDALSRQVASLQGKFASQEQAALEAALSPVDALRMGSYPSGADVSQAGTTTLGFANILADNVVATGLAVRNAGSVVIVDGTSNMFKIAASGSLSVTATAGAANSIASTLTALGTLSTTPAHLSFVSRDNALTGYRHLGSRFESITSATYVANTSGGGTTQAMTSPRTHASVSTGLNASDQCVVNLYLMNGGYVTSQTAYAYYHVLKEAAL